jgi:hypothetical protein
VRTNKKTSGLVLSDRIIGCVTAAVHVGDKLRFYSPEQHKAKVRHFSETSETTI